MPLCLIGRARTVSDSSSSSFASSSSSHYLELLKQWGALEDGTLSRPRCECSVLLEEARVAVGWENGRSGSGDVSGKLSEPRWATGIVVLVGVGGMVVGMVVGVLLLQFGLFSKKKRANGAALSPPLSFPQQDVEHNRLLSEDFVTVRKES